MNYYSFICFSFALQPLVKYEFSFSATSVGLVTIFFPLFSSNLRSFNGTLPILKLWGADGLELKTFWLVHSSLYFFHILSPPKSLNKLQLCQDPCHASLHYNSIIASNCQPTLLCPCWISELFDLCHIGKARKVKQP